MSRFSFIHAADLHLGSPFQSLAVKDAAIAGRFAQATRTAFTRLVDRAIGLKVDFLVIAGDIYDGEWKDNAIGLFFNREVARLAQAGIAVVFLRGNHDAASIVTKSVPLPETVHQFPTNKPATIEMEEIGVALHGQGFAERVTEANLASTYPAPRPGFFNIGVLHTSLTGHPAHAVYAPCTVDELANKGYDYWALGHVHDHDVVSEHPHIVFPGNLQGRNIREAGEKGAVLVTVEDDRVSGLERLILDEARWMRLAVDISDQAEPGTIANAVAAAFAGEVESAGDRLIALRVELTGSCNFRRQLIAQKAAIADDIQAACHHVHPDAWLERLVLDAVSTTQERTRPAIDASIDLEAMLDAVLADPGARADADQLIATMTAKLPGGIGAAEAPLGDPDDLMREARDLLLARSQSEE